MNQPDRLTPEQIEYECAAAIQSGIASPTLSRTLRDMALHPSPEAVREACAKIAKLCSDPNSPVGGSVEECIRAIDLSKINAAQQDEPAGLHTSAPTITGEVRTPAGAAPDLRELLRECHEVIEALRPLLKGDARLWVVEDKRIILLLEKLDAALLAQPAAAGVSEERIREITHRVLDAHQDSPLTLYTVGQMIDSALRHSLSERADRVSEGMVEVPENELKTLIEEAKYLCEHGNGDYSMRDRLRRAGKAFDAAMALRLAAANKGEG